MASITHNTVRQHIYELVDKGLLFRNTYKYDLADEGVGYMLIKVGAKYPHVLLKAQGDGDTDIEFYHTPTVTLDGTEEVAGNLNTNSSNTSLTTWFPGPTIGADGTIMAHSWILGGSGVGTPAAARAADSMEDIDIVLIPNVEFLIKFTNTSGRAIQVVFETIYREVLKDYS